VFGGVAYFLAAIWSSFSQNTLFLGVIFRQPVVNRCNDNRFLLLANTGLPSPCGLWGALGIRTAHEMIEPQIESIPPLAFFK